MVWTAIYRRSDGTLVGCGTVLPAELPEGTEVREYAERPDQGTRWDSALRDFVALPPLVRIDRLADFAAHPYLSNVWSRLTSPQRTQLRKALVWLLGARRYREEGEEISLDVEPDWPTDPDRAVE